MLLNPYRDRPSSIPGTRMLEGTFGVVGTRIPDPDNLLRFWDIQGLYLPLKSRAIGGIRAKLVDQKGYVTFCNQRDLEVLLGVGTPGRYCNWSGQHYVDPDDPEWFGFCCDEEDLLDDLYEREILLRAQSVHTGGILYPTPDFDINRRVHLGKNNDVEDHFVLVQDIDPETGFFPDTRFETLQRRWIRSERVRIRWERT